MSAKQVNPFVLTAPRAGWPVASETCLRDNPMDAQIHTTYNLPTLVKHWSLWLASH